jgi:exodeoxyribonuclease VII small subunit
MTLENLTLEEALQQLDTIVRQLESGEGSLDAAVGLFEQGQLLVKRCQQDLDAKELRLQQLLDDDTLAPFNR